MSCSGPPTPCYWGTVSVLILSGFNAQFMVIFLDCLASSLMPVPVKWVYFYMPRASIHQWCKCIPLATNHNQHPHSYTPLIYGPFGSPAIQASRGMNQPTSTVQHKMRQPSSLGRIQTKSCIPWGLYSAPHSSPGLQVDLGLLVALL